MVPLSGGVPTVFNTLSAEKLHGYTGHKKSPGSEFMAMSYNPASQVLTVVHTRRCLVSATQPTA